jgi:ubiquitin C-terminal hydrolase
MPNMMGEKSKTGFVGLKNLGCICYMNSLMQQFYMIKDFREAILEVDSSAISNEPIENMLLQF